MHIPQYKLLLFPLGIVSGVLYSNLIALPEASISPQVTYMYVIRSRKTYQTKRCKVVGT